MHWTKTLENVFPTGDPDAGSHAGRRREATPDDGLYSRTAIYVCKHKIASPRVFIPVFPGTNCEYDSTKGL